ncbi:hypothetical protein [Kamptonema formosum]|uniref:hypothetical protein n=1 Tax=Kamptonema formosum TaxID=331992 RepID=UPI00035D9A46|nr:hypothetical protein [Oscillatoria sp. PCC 10802]
MSIHKQLPTSIDNIRAKVRPLLRPIFWGPAGVLLLVALFISEYRAHPERFSSLVSQENNPDGASGLTEEERAKAADMDSVSVLLKELKQAGAAPGQKTEAPPTKGLFEEIDSRAKESAPAAKPGAGAQNSASGKQDQTAQDGSPLSPSALQALGILPGNKPAGVRSESPAAGQRYSTTAGTGSLLPASPEMAPASPLQAAMDRYYGRVPSSAEPASPSAPSASFQQSSGAALPLASSRATPAQAPLSANPDGRSYLEAATGMPVPESATPISPRTLNLPGLTGLTPTDAANRAISPNAYTYLTGSGPAADAPTGNPLQPQGSAAAQNTAGQIPFGGLNQGLGATPLGNPLGGSTPATGATTPSSGMQEIYQRLGITPPSAIYQNVTPPLGVSAPGAAYQNVTPTLGVSAPSPTYQGISPGAGVTSPGSAYQGVNSGAGVTSPGSAYQGVNPGIGVTSPGAPYPGVSPGIGANMPANPYNYGNPSAGPAQPAQQPNFSVPRTIGGGQINTFSNP